MRLLIDTNRYGDLVARDLDVTDRLQRSTEAWLSFVTLGELLAGFSLGSRQVENQLQLQQMLGLQGVGVLLADEETAEFYSKVYVQLRRQGTPIPANDMWIAAQALQHNLTLDTRDKHFKLVSDLKLVE